MWVITVYSKENTKMFEFDTEREARETFEKIQGNKILSEIIYFNDSCLETAVQGSYHILLGFPVFSLFLLLDDSLLYAIPGLRKYIQIGKEQL